MYANIRPEVDENLAHFFDGKSQKSHLLIINNNIIYLCISVFQQLHIIMTFSFYLEPNPLKIRMTFFLNVFSKIRLALYMHRATNKLFINIYYLLKYNI